MKDFRFWRNRKLEEDVQAPAPIDIRKHNPENIRSQHIVCAALKFSDDLIVCAPRHSDTIMKAIIARIPEVETDYADLLYTEGFVDQYGTFFTREEAYKIALKNEQFKPSEFDDNRSLTSVLLY